jgi:hypothetical protein
MSHMLIRFLQDYQGYLTPGHFYRVGQEVDITDDGRAQALLDAGRAELVEVFVPDEPVYVMPEADEEPTWMTLELKRKPGRPKRA